ncbi:MAG: hypothetical protein E6J43_02315 [Chloroflexi bacterium]|nr:MAG: hypothetical protein E6J43_02315 [Chloroflexota bacterium]
MRSPTCSPPRKSGVETLASGHRELVTVQIIGPNETDENGEVLILIDESLLSLVIITTGQSESETLDCLADFDTPATVIIIESERCVEISELISNCPLSNFWH